MEYYSISEFAKMVGVSKKAIMYYQNMGLLQPSEIRENGYRYYTKQDIVSLQKIVVMKRLGIPVKEIKKVLDSINGDNLSDSLHKQVMLIEEEIKSLSRIKKIINGVEGYIDSKQTINWEKIIYLINILSMKEDVIEQYKNSKNLEARIMLHKLYSANKETWYRWLYKHYEIPEYANILEIGCGTGDLWYENQERINKNMKLFLSDSSFGMLNDAEEKIGQLVNADYNVADCCKLPYEDNSMDVVIANHVLFYANNLEQALMEVSRVLKKNGSFYCATYGSEHMKMIETLVKNFDSRINLSTIRLYEIFGLENGENILKKYFKKVQCKSYNDALYITEVEPLYRYIMSCHGNQEEFIVEKKEKFIMYLEKCLEKKKSICVKKQAGVFICKMLKENI